jgi:hypothetical protein
MENLYYNCEFCNFKTKRKYNLLRHQNAMHKIINNDNKNLHEDNKKPHFDNTKPHFNNKKPHFDNTNLHDDNKCNKCFKIFSSKQYLKKHLLICKGISNPLECHFCHKIYASYNSKSNHLKICKEKTKETFELVPDEIKVDKQTFQLIKPLEQNINNTLILNNNCNNNITYNINLVRFNEEELKIDFDIKHLDNNNIVHKLYIIAVEDAFRLFYKKLFENKNNQMIIKQNLKHTYSNVHTGRNIWQKMLDDYIYHIIMHFIAETLLSYIYNNTKNKEDSNYIRLREYGDYMATKGYSSKNTKEIEKSYKNQIKSLKYLFNTFKD